MAQNDQPVKLSKAMFRAAGLLPQAFGDFFETDAVTNEIIGTCALGAVLLSANLTEFYCASDWLGHFVRSFGVELTKYKVVNPVTGNTSTLYMTITHLNDKAKWSRRRIAAWLRSIDL